MRSLLQVVGGYVFPPRCPWCGQVLAREERCRCETDVDALTLPDTASDGWRPPVKLPFASPLVACYIYKDTVRSGILRFKAEGYGAAPALAQRMGQKLRDTAFAERFDCLVPVPSSRSNVRRRGYSHTHLLAKYAGRQLSLPVYGKLLCKVADTPPQASLDAVQRTANLLGAFEVRTPAEIRGRRVLLVDDLVTTGSTLDECAKMILVAGAAECGALCLAATPPPNSVEQAAASENNEQPEQPPRA